MTDTAPQQPSDYAKASVDFSLTERFGSKVSKEVGPLHGGGGGSGMDPLEPRVAKLEAHTEHLVSDVGDLRNDMKAALDKLARLETKVSHLPTTGTMFAALIGLLALMTALIAFQDQVRGYTKSPDSATVAPAP